jgi:hypothetical protein
MLKHRSFLLNFKNKCQNVLFTVTEKLSITKTPRLLLPLSIQSSLKLTNAFVSLTIGAGFYTLRHPLEKQLQRKC